MIRIETKDPEIFQSESGVFYYRGTPPGFKKTVEKSLQTKLFREARARKAEMLLKFSTDGFAVQKRIAEQLLKKYLQYRLDNQEKNNWSENTMKGDSYIINNFLIPHFGKKALSQIDDVEFDQFTTAFGRRDYTNHAKVLRMFMKWAKKQKLVAHVPDFELPRWQKRQRAVLKINEMEELLRHAHGNILLFIGMYLFMGMRKSEILKLRWADVNLAEKWILIRRETSMRSGKSRVIPINDFVLNLLNAKRKGAATEWVFPNKRKAGKTPYMSQDGFNRPWQRLLARAGIDRRITPHDLRATYQTYAHKKREFTETQLMKMSGSSVETQRGHYVSMEADDLRGLESVVAFPELQSILASKTGEIDGDR